MGPWFEQFPGFDIYSANVVLMIIVGVIQLILTWVLVVEHEDFSKMA